MERWPGHEKQERSQVTDKSKNKGKQKEHCREPGFWQWPHLEHGSIGRATLVSRGGRVQWSTVVDTSHGLRWFPLGRLTKVFPETRSPQVNVHEYSTRQRAEKGLQYLRTHFPDAEFPDQLLGSTLEAETRETRRLNAFDPLVGNMLEIIPSHHTQNESAVVFPMGELGRGLNISRFSSNRSGNMVFNPAGSPSFVFETPILQISSAVGSSNWIASPYSTLLVRTHTSSSLLHLEHSKVTRELDITRSEVGGIPIVDSRILASGPDIIVVNQCGKVYKCTTYHGSKAMQLIGGYEVSDDDHFWQLGITGRIDGCFLASCKAIKHIDLRSTSSATDVFSLDHPSAIVTSFESPMYDYSSRITTTSDVIWLDDRFRGRPLLSVKHYRSLDRTLRVLTANLSGTALSMLTSRRNSLVTLYDVNKGSDGLLHSNSTPSCLPHHGPMFTTYDGHAFIALPSEVELTFLRLGQRGSIHRQDIRVVRSDEDRSGSAQEGRITHQWDEDVHALAKQANELQIDFGPAGGRHHTEVNLRGAYEEIFATADDTQEEVESDTLRDTLARLPDVWQNIVGATKNMLTTSDVVSGLVNGNRYTTHTDILAGGNTDPKRALEALRHDPLVAQKLAGLARWHYNIQDTSIPGLNYHFVDDNALHEYPKELKPVSVVERRDTSVRRETEAREQLVLDLALSNDVYSAWPGPYAEPHCSATDGATSNTVANTVGMSYGEEPPEVKFGYFRSVRKTDADYYANKDRDGEQAPGVSSPLGVRLLLAEWELGTDPRDYTYHDPYGLADAEPIPQYSRLPPALPATQKRQLPPQRPPLVVAAATLPPVVHAVEHAPPTIQSQLVQRTHSQLSEHGSEAFSQVPMTSTQVLPGPFGGRPGAGKKPARKRMGGF